MIQAEMLGKAIRAVQHVIIQGRRMAYDRAPHERIATLLDHGEYLPALLLDPTDQTVTFRDYLMGIVEDFPETQWILDDYRR